MAGLTSTGFEILRLPEIKEGLEEEAVQIFSDLVPTGDVVDVSPNSILGRLIGIVSPAHAAIWEGLQQVHDSFNPNAATGYSLDNIVALSGIVRRDEAPTRASVLLEGNANTAISLSARASSQATKRSFSFVAPVTLNLSSCTGVGLTTATVADSTDYTVSYTVDGSTYTDITINSGIGATAGTILNALLDEVNANTGGAFTSYWKNGILFIERTDPFQTVTVEVTANLSVLKVIKLGLVQCDEIGPLPQPANTIDTISVPVSGWDSVYNPQSATLGNYRETDEELRERFRNSKFFQAQNIIEALISALANVEGVTDLIVYENDTDITDAYGVPAHSFMPIVQGGLTTAIAEAIWQNKPTGIRSYGNTTVSIADSQGIMHNISFTRPTLVPIYVSVSISSTGSLAGDAPAQIKQKVYEYLSGNYAIGDDIIYSRLYTPVNSVPGHQVNSLTLGTSPSPVGTSNVAIAFDEIGSFSTENIVVTVV